MWRDTGTPKSNFQTLDLKEWALTFCVVLFYDFGLCFELESAGRPTRKREEILFQIRRQIERTLDAQWTKDIILTWGKLVAQFGLTTIIPDKYFSRVCLDIFSTINPRISEL